MGSNSNRVDRLDAASYAATRLNNRLDDQSEPSKMWLDARLRGELGTHKANRLIAAIDKYKSTR